MRAAPAEAGRPAGRARRRHRFPCLTASNLNSGSRALRSLVYPLADHFSMDICTTCGGDLGALGDGASSPRTR